MSPSRASNTTARRCEPWEADSHGATLEHDHTGCRLKRAIAFYQDVVGWKAAPGPSEIAFFDLGGLVFSLYPHDDMARDMSAAGDDRSDSAYQGFAIAHNPRSMAEVDAIFSRLKVKGATISKAPEEVFRGGYSGYFSDPDGHAWEVAYNPHWAIGKDGRVSMTKA